MNDKGNQNKVNTIYYVQYKFKIMQKQENNYIYCDYSNQ